MYSLLIKLFLRQKATLISFILLLTLGLASIGVGRQFLNLQERNIQDVAETQERHIQAQLKAHPDDIGLILYYLKFAYINTLNPLAGIAIGQTDLNNNIEHITILALEGQKYDTDLVSPIKLQAGNLDLSFVIIFLFPLVIIALTFNLWYEEVERGTWKMIKIQGKSVFQFLLAKLLIRVALIASALAILFITAKFILDIPLSLRFAALIIISFAYLIFWFALSIFVISMKRTSGFNAVVLLMLWLVLVILLPAGINNYVTSKYPVEEALSLSIKQRDEYHKKWDTDKRKTVEKFNECYPQFKKYPVQDSGFTWHWFYAMQHMGDLESASKHKEMLHKIEQREHLSNQIANFIPSVKIQLALNELAYTDLSSYLAFLDATTTFHEKKRLEFYPVIFENSPAQSINWAKYKPEFYKREHTFSLISMLWSTLLISTICLAIGLYRLSKF